MKFPSLSQWLQIFKVLNKAEKIFFVILLVLAFISAIFLASLFYVNNTRIVPASGRNYTEGIIGQPRFINPIYGETNDVDRALIELIYSGLMAYDKNGQITTDLAENYKVSEDGRIYTFELKDSLFWQDGVPLTADDIIYTIKTIQDPEYKSPLRANWLNIDVEKISENSLAFLLETSYNSFLENATVKIMPEHIWKNVLPQNFTLSSYNLQPVGSGAYNISSIEQDNNGFIKNLTLSANRRYYGKVPYISNISFRFFENENSLIKAAKQKTIDGFSTALLEQDVSSIEQQLKPAWGQEEKFNVYSFSMPRYFAVFFNTEKSKILSDENITQALNYATDKQEIAKNISSPEKDVLVSNSPILPNYFGYQEPTTSYAFNQGIAKELLDKSGYEEQNPPAGGGIRAKINDKSPSFQFKSYLKIGSSGNEVVELQGCLARLDEEFLNLLQNETSGKYGKGTGEAVNKFQEKYMPDVEPTAEVGPGTRSKLNELCFEEKDNLLPLQISLVTIKQPQLEKTANSLKDYWQQVGVSTDIKAVDLSELKEIIKNRDYDALLYGQALSSLPDLYPFWHSTQVNDPGLNLSYYQNKDVDRLLKQGRETLDENIKKQAYEELQNLILSDAPALFLYNPDYVYLISNKIKGIDTTKITDPAKRFSNIENWYIKTRRTWK